MSECVKPYLAQEDQPSTVCRDWEGDWEEDWEED